MLSRPEPRVSGRAALLLVCCTGWTIAGCGEQSATESPAAPRAQDKKTPAAHAAEAKTLIRASSRDALLEALRRVGEAGEAHIVLADGHYGYLKLSQKYRKPLVIRAKHPGKATFDRAYLKGARNVVLEGLVFDRKDDPSAKNVVQVSSGSGMVVLRNCTMTHGTRGHDNTDSLKLNSDVDHVLIEGCRIFDGTDEEVDILGNVRDIVFRRNVFFQAKARKVEAMVSSKRGTTRRIVFDGNVFANTNPDSSNGALRFGGSQQAGGESKDLIAVHNVFVNTRGKAAMAYWGHRRSLVAYNVFLNHEGKCVVGINANYRKANPIVNDEFFFVNNVIAHMQGRLPVPFRHWFTENKTYLIRNNLYWNAGRPIAKGNFHDPNTEAGAIIADPRFVADHKVTGPPSLAWLRHLELAADSPFRRGRYELTKLKLPPELQRFWNDYTTGAGDPWYREIGLPDWAPAP